ncbi:MAG TPA: hypothetical protein VK587_15705 [bacterium]|nr:hypothetical protein [bacterium]
MLAPFRRATARQVIFGAYAFGPSLLLYLLPLPFSRIPLVVYLNYNRETVVAGRFVALAVAVAFVWFLVAGGLVLWPAAKRAAPRDWPAPVLWWAFIAFSLLGSAISLFHTGFEAPATVEEIINQLAFAPVIGCLLGVQILRGLAGPVSRPASVAVWGLIALDLVVALAVPLLLGRATPVALGLIAILYGLTVVGIPGRRLAVLVVLFLVIIGAALPLREYLRATLDTGTGIQRTLGPARSAQARGRAPEGSQQPGSFENDRLDVFNPWVQGFWFHRARSRPLLLLQFGVARAIHRINRLSDLAYIVELTPRTIPYTHGTTYAPLIGAAVPRVLWPNKPAEEAGQFYGHRYGFLDPSDTSHSDNLPIVVEGWISGGWAGVLASALFVGLVLRVIWTYWIGDGTAPGTVMIGMAVIGTVADGDSNLSLVMGGVAHALLIYWALDVLIRAWGRARVARRIATSA